jgi:hypothetical protein
MGPALPCAAHFLASSTLSCTFLLYSYRFLPHPRLLLGQHLINPIRHPTHLHAIHPHPQHILHHFLSSNHMFFHGPLPQSFVAICLGRYSSNCLSCAGTELPKRLSVYGPSSKKLSSVGHWTRRSLSVGGTLPMKSSFLWVSFPCGVSVPLRLSWVSFPRGVSVPLRFPWVSSPSFWVSFPSFSWVSFPFSVGFQSPSFPWVSFPRGVSVPPSSRLFSVSVGRCHSVSVHPPLHTRHFRSVLHTTALHLPTPSTCTTSAHTVRATPQLASPPILLASPRLPPPPPSTMGHALPATAIRVPPLPFHLPCLSTGIFQHCTVLPTVCAEGEFPISRSFPLLAPLSATPRFILFQPDPVPPILLPTSEPSCCADPRTSSLVSSALHSSFGPCHCHTFRPSCIAPNGTRCHTALASPQIPHSFIEDQLVHLCSTFLPFVLRGSVRTQGV